MAPAALERHQTRAGLASSPTPVARIAECAGSFGARSPILRLRRPAPIAPPVLRRRAGRSVQAARVARRAEFLVPPWRFGVIGAAPAAGPVVRARAGLAVFPTPVARGAERVRAVRASALLAIGSWTPIALPGLHPLMLSGPISWLTDEGSPNSWSPGGKGSKTMPSREAPPSRACVRAQAATAALESDWTLGPTPRPGRGV